MQAEAEGLKSQEILQSEVDQLSEISLARRKPQEQRSSAQDPRAHSQPKLEDVTSKESFDKVKIRLGEINKRVSDSVANLAQGVFAQMCVAAFAEWRLRTRP